MPTRPATASPRRRSALRSAMAGLALCAGLAAPASADPRAIAHYERLPRAERVAIEYDLIWVGGVDMVTNGTVGPQSIVAIRRFEESIERGRVDGILDEAERRVLARRAERIRERAGYRVVLDSATGMRIGIPFAYVKERRATQHGALYEGPQARIETFALRQGLLETHAATLLKPGRRVTYQVLRDDWFVVAGREGDAEFYIRAHASGGELRAFTATYEAGLIGMERILTAMSNDLRPFAKGAVGGLPAPAPGAGARADRGAPTDLDGLGDDLAGLDGRTGLDGRAGDRPRAEGPPEYTGPGSIERDYEGPLGPDGASCAEIITVSEGDTLSAIAARCGVSLSALRAANGGIDPYGLRAGQSLAIPRAGEPSYGAAEDQSGEEAYRPAIAVRPRAMREGETVSIALTGFPSGAEVEVTLRTDDAAHAERVLLTGSGGAAAVQLELPSTVVAGRAVTVAARAGPHAAQAGPFVVRPAEDGAAPAAARVTLSGMITGEGGACLSMRDSTGTLWMLDSARSVSPGTAVTVEGFPAGPEAAARCGGQAIEVARLSVR